MAIWDTPGTIFGGGFARLGGTFGNLVPMWTAPAAPSAPIAAAAPAATPVPEAAVAASNGAISDTPIPISWGQRRIVGKVIDHITKPLGADGIGSEILCISAGQPLFRDVANDLVKIVANGTT